MNFSHPWKKSCWSPWIQPCENDDKDDEEAEDDQEADGCYDPEQIDSGTLLKHLGVGHH